MNYFDKTKILNSNPVLLARHFQYRVEVFFKEIVSDGTLGKIKHYAIRVEFQVRGSPHIHSLVWVIGAPILSTTSEDEYVAFIDNIIKCELPNPQERPRLFELVRTYQTHSHSKSYRKYKNMKCRYSFGKYFTDHTIIAHPLSDKLLVEEKALILQQRKLVLSTVKKYIDTYLNPKTNNLYSQTENVYQSDKPINAILQELQISEDQYYKDLSISSDSAFQIHFKRDRKSCFINNYFEDGLMAWEGNLDIQPVLDYYKAVSYTCAYLSKSEDESSQAMKQEAREAYESGKPVCERMKSVARAYRTHRKMSIQEAVTIALPELWLRKTCPTVVFANSNLPEKRYRICRSEAEILNIPANSKDLLKRNMLDRYIDRPNKIFRQGKYQLLDDMCYEEFISNYSLE